MKVGHFSWCRPTCNGLQNRATCVGVKRTCHRRRDSANVLQTLLNMCSDPEEVTYNVPSDPDATDQTSVGFPEDFLRLCATSVHVLDPHYVSLSAHG